jgi:hypothetical protein
MTSFFKSILKVGCVLVISGHAVNSQTAQQQGLASTTQVLDTSVLFAIGAREAEQAIRGSFGWPTFQEGFVERVYFRFDPDGYARFSASPRLDEDVFEVICAESSTACIARKQGFEIGLTAEGKVQLKIADITPQDSFHVADRKSELPVPPSVLEPLDARLETLLASSAHLVVKRELETIQRISLSGFSAVSTYLRWVAQGQSPRVFPRGWPVPAQIETLQTGGLTQPGAWDTPTFGPQKVQTTYSQVNQASGGFSGRSFGNQNTLQAQNNVRSFGQTLGTANGNTAANYGGASFGQNALGVDQAGTSLQGMNQVNAMVQSLQNELDQLRSMQTQAGASGSSSLDELSEGFAQQAQARNLSEPHGYGTDFDQSRNLSQVGSLQADFGQMGSPQTFPNAGSVFGQQTLTVLDQRMSALEQAVWQMNRTLMTELQNLKFAQQSNVRDAVPSMTAQTQSETPGAVGKMDALERLLVERLGARDPLPTAPVGQVGLSTASEPAESEREFVMDLLKQLEGTDVASDPAVEQIAEVEGDNTGGGYVSLADYLNQVLESETKKTHRRE